MNIAEPTDQEIAASKAKRRFYSRLILHVIQDAYEIQLYRATGQWKPIYKFQFGFARPTEIKLQTEKELNRLVADRYKRVWIEIEGWISTEEFHNICTMLGLISRECRERILGILNGIVPDVVLENLEEIDKELQNYAIAPSPNSREKAEKAKDAESASKLSA